MSLANPIQNIQDWITQQWVILFGRKINPETHHWLMGPFGELGSIGTEFFEQLAKSEGLEIIRNTSTGGILSSIEDLNLSEEDFQRLSKKVTHFYENTAQYDLKLEVKWNVLFKPFGFAVKKLFSQRINQLNIPMENQENSSQIKSEIISLKNPKTGEIKYRIWYRTDLKNDQVIYSGIYTTCQLPSGQTCVKAIFPLPQGSATIILKPSVGEKGELTLESSGEKFGEAGFYFLLKDIRGKYWSKYVRPFREQLKVSENGDRVEANQQLTLWHQNVVNFKYKIQFLSSPKN